MSNPFWEYSLSAYAAPGVADACLSAQDDCGVDVNLLLYAAWLSHNGQLLTEEHLTGLEAAVRDWRVRAVEPLRRLRRDLKSLPGAQDLREQVKALELSAERQQQDILWQCHCKAESLPAAASSLASNLERVLRAAKTPESAAADLLARLVAALEGVAEASAQ